MYVARCTPGVTTTWTWECVGNDYDLYSYQWGQPMNIVLMPDGSLAVATVGARGAILYAYAEGASDYAPYSPVQDTWRPVPLYVLDPWSFNGIWICSCKSIGGTVYMLFTDPRPNPSLGIDMPVSLAKYAGAASTVQEGCVYSAH